MNMLTKSSRWGVGPAVAVAAANSVAPLSSIALLTYAPLAPFPSVLVGSHVPVPYFSARVSLALPH